MISNLGLYNFRSHTTAKFSFSEKTNIILGKNGTGKTNILEAILVLTQGKSYRATDTDLINFDNNNAKVEGEFDGKKRDIKLQRSQPKIFTINNTQYKRMAFANTIPTVLFEPDFTQIISRGPDKRREYFDGVLSRIKPEYQTILNKYKRILTQRNALLKSSKFSNDEMFIWNIKLSELGSQIALSRIDHVETINKKISEIYNDLASTKSTIKIEYITKNNKKNYSDSLLRNLEKNILLDKAQGFTSFGPHRDDFKFTINDQEVSTSASRGENRTLLLALKIIEANLIKIARDKSPILLLDDVFSELDESRQAKLVDFFYHHQVIITTTTITPLMQGVSGEIIEL